MDNLGIIDNNSGSSSSSGSGSRKHNHSSRCLFDLTDEDFDSMRLKGDVLADDLLIQYPNQPEVQERLLADAILMRININEAKSESKKAVAKSVVDALSMEDALRMERIRHLFSKYFPFTGLILLCGSLPAAYSAAKGAETLKCTGRMYKEPKKRIMETTLFLHHIFEHTYLNSNNEREYNTFLREHPGFRAILQVRLLHARVRSHVSKLPKNIYDENVNGVPVNQEDLLGTLTTFSFVVLLGLERLGFKITTEQKEDYSFFWNQVGKWMGCQCIANSLSEEESVCWKIRNRHNQPSRYSQKMVRVLFEKMAPPNSTEKYVSNTRISLSTMCWMLDSDLASRLDLEFSRSSYLKWKLCIYVFKAYALFSFCYQQMFGCPMINMGSLLGELSKKALKDMNIKQPFVFSVAY